MFTEAPRTRFNPRTYTRCDVVRPIDHTTYKSLAQKYGFTYESVKINSSKGRWGSCSAKRGINLSYFLVLLPQHLIDYVLLHELCHTREMNHGEKFWSILNSVTSGRAHELREELRKYKTDI